MPIPAGVQLVRTAGKGTFSSALHFAPNSPLLELMEQAILVSRASWKHEGRAQASRRLWGREWKQATCSLEFIY